MKIKNHKLWINVEREMIDQNGKSNSNIAKLVSKMIGIFKPVIQTFENIKSIGYKQVFVQKCNENNEIMRYKVQFVTQGFSQKLLQII